MTVIRARLNLACRSRSGGSVIPLRCQPALSTIHNQPTGERAMLFAEKPSHPWRSRLVAFTLLIGTTPPLFASGEVLAQGMNNMGTKPGMGDAKPMATGTGTVTAVNTAGRKVTLDHGPMPTLKWPAMKMEFPVAPSVDLSKVKAGDKVEFTLSASGSSFTVQSIAPGK